MQPGERIAIKAAYVQRRGLPFDNKNVPVSVMAIKAVGTIVENLNDGRRIRVDWSPSNEPRLWLFYTFRQTLWRVTAERPEARALIRFAFEGEAQDIEGWLQKAPWRERYGVEPHARPSTPEATIADLEEAGASSPPYDISSILADGCFLARRQLQDALDLLHRKKNLILQGPPGTGKTWLAKRLAFARLGQQDKSRVTAMQFQPSLSYEDFVRGWRPDGGGGLRLADGLFLQAVSAALAAPDRDHVVVIEEINRGNPAQIFGELLTLLEADKRGPDEALRLAYTRPEEPGERVYLPPNLYVIGTMNLADRSLALVDLALRRRFAFVTLEPRLNEAWREWCGSRGADPAVLNVIADRMAALNAAISTERSLGEQYCIGHSFVTPTRDEADWSTWFRSVVEAEIAPLLAEYWYDNPARATTEREALLAGF